jgi:hypothetical protein
MDSLLEFANEIESLSTDPWKAFHFKQDPVNYCDSLDVSTEAKRKLRNANHEAIFSFFYCLASQGVGPALDPEGVGNVIVVGALIVTQPSPPPKDK